MAADLGDRLVNVFIKCEADPTGRLRSRRQVALDDSDVHHHRHIKGAVGGVAAAAVGDPAVFVSVAALHQGPSGGGPVAAVVDVGDGLRFVARQALAHRPGPAELASTGYVTPGPRPCAC